MPPDLVAAAEAALEGLPGQDEVTKEFLKVGGVLTGFRSICVHMHLTNIANMIKIKDLLLFWQSKC